MVNTASGSTRLSPSRTANINEQLSWTKGTHSIKFGFEYLRADYARIDCNGCTGEADFSANTTAIPGASSQTGDSFRLLPARLALVR